MTDDRRPGDFVDALGRGLVIYYTFPLLIMLLSVLGMIAGLILATPCFLIFWKTPEQFLVEHTGLSLVFWGLGTVLVLKRLFFAGNP